MKRSLFILIVAFGSVVYGQTDSIEKAVLRNKILAKEIEESEFSKIWIRWNQAISEVKYPDLPLDQNGQVHYIFINEFERFDKDTLFTRTLEWLSINYGIIPSAIYSSLKEGKIILRNSLEPANGKTCIYTTIISIKEKKIRMEIINILYQTFYEGHYSSDTWIPEKTINTRINEVYPIVLKKPVEWNSNLNLLRRTNELFDKEFKNLCDYIISFENSDKF